MLIPLHELVNALVVLHAEHSTLLLHLDLTKQNKFVDQVIFGSFKVVNKVFLHIFLLVAPSCRLSWHSFLSLVYMDRIGAIFDPNHTIVTHLELGGRSRRALSRLALAYAHFVAVVLFPQIVSFNHFPADDVLLLMIRP